MSQPTDLSPLKQAYLAIERLQAKVDELQAERAEPIAILGMACRFPGASSSPERFWRMLRDGGDGVSEVPPERWDADAFFDPDSQQPGRIGTRWGGFLERIDAFDARFFGIAPREALQMDPQQRLLLEVAWDAFEAAGQPPDRLAGSRTGVFVGLLNSEYGWLQVRDIAGLDAYSGTGTSPSVASGRLSYCLGLQGPSVTLDTACSSSLVAIHLACQALRGGECRLALAGGVSVMLTPLSLLPFSRMGLLAADGRCKTLDQRADGFVGGEGCGLVVLKRLSQALADGDPILALVLGSAVNQDGRTTMLSAPSGVAQAGVIAAALESAGVAPDEVSYVEMHGTGTPFGDPVEVDALHSVFGAARRDRNACALGAVKTNIGHTGGAAGVAGIIKTVLALQHDLIPPNLHFREPNPHLRLEDSPFVVPTASIAWTARRPRRAGVSAFGWSGTNAHVVLGDPPAQPSAPAPDRPAWILPVSARDPAALVELAGLYRARLKPPIAGGEPDSPGEALGDLLYTIAARRSHHDRRIAVVGRTRAELADGLTSFIADPAHPREGVMIGDRRPRSPKLVFVFSPHGGQWVGMGRGLYRHSRTFRDALDRCQAAMAPWIDWSILDNLARDDDTWLGRIDTLQPTLFALQVALAAEWRGWGIEPDAIVGHSMGEVAAAHVAGVLTLEDAARVICRRTALLQRLAGQGTMGIVELSRHQAEAAISPFQGRLSIAACNSPRFTVVAGERDALESLFEGLERDDVFCGWGVADVASHTPRMKALEADLQTAIGSVTPSGARTPLYSTVTGRPCDGRDLDARYWSAHLSQPVLFADVVQQLAVAGHDVYLEIAPAPVLGPAIDEGLLYAGVDGTTLASLRRDADDLESMLLALGRLYALGWPVQWSSVYPHGQCVDVPSYPWQRERFWLPGEAGRVRLDAAPGRQGVVSSTLGERVDIADEPDKEIWLAELDRRTHSAWFEHRVFGTPILPASAYVEMAGAAVSPGEVVRVTDLVLHEALRLSESAPWTQTQFAVRRGDEQAAAFQLSSRAGEEWRRHVSGTVWRTGETSSTETAGRWNPGGLELPHLISGEAVYRRFESLGVQYGPSLRVLGEIRFADGRAIARLTLSKGVCHDAASGGLPTPIIDACLQLLAWHAVDASESEAEPLVPTAIGAIEWRRGRIPSWAYVSLERDERGGASGRAVLVDDQQQLVAQFDGIQFTTLSDAATGRANECLYEVVWRPTPSVEAPTGRMGPWIVLADTGGIGDALAAQLTARGENVVLARAADDCGRQDDHSWNVRPAEPADYEALLTTAVSPGGGAMPVVVHLWALETDRAVEEPIDSSFQFTVGPLLYLVRAAKRLLPDGGCRLWLVTKGSQAVLNHDVAACQSTLWGAGRVLAEEHHELWGGLIDLDPQAVLQASASQIAAQVHGGGREDQVAFRHDTRYAPRLVRRSHPDPSALPPIRFVPDGTYVITGGFGGIGVQVARWMVSQGARRLMLIGRTPLPSRSEWDGIDPSTPVGRRVHSVRSLEGLGAAIHPVAADVSDVASLAAALDQYRAEAWPPVRGVIHCAGIIDDRLLTELDIDSVRRVAAPKMLGAWNLHKYFEHVPLDCFILFSSSGALMGAAGQGNYAAANAFLDALAHARRARGLPAVSINWGFWHDLGFAATPGGRRLIAHMSKTGLLPFSPAQGLEAFRLLLDAPPDAGAAALRIDWRRAGREMATGGGSAFLSELLRSHLEDDRQASAMSMVEALKATDPALRRDRLEAFLRDELAAVLHLDKRHLDAETALGSFGVDSFMAIELRNRLERTFGLRLSATIAWNYPTIAAMATYLSDRIGLPLATTPPPADAGGPAPGDLASLLTDIEALSEDELGRMLRELAVRDERTGSM